MFLQNHTGRFSSLFQKFTSTYRYGFNGKEKDDDVAGAGNTYDYGFRIHNSQLGRFLSVDPLFKNYPWNSTYAFAENDIIRCIDLDGLEKFVITVKQIETVNNTVVKKQDADFIVYSMNFSNVYEDGSVENLNPDKPIIMFENKSAQEGADKSGNKIKMGKLYGLSWAEWKGEKNMGILFEKSPGRVDKVIQISSTRRTKLTTSRRSKLTTLRRSKLTTPKVRNFLAD